MCNSVSWSKENCISERMNRKLPHKDVCSSTPTKTISNQYCCLSEHFSQSQFTLPFISHFPVPSQMPLLGYTAFILSDVLNFKWRGQGGNHQFRHQSMCHLFFVLKSYCVTIKGSFLQLFKIKSWAWPENPPLEILGRVGDVQYIAVLILVCRHASHTHRNRDVLRLFCICTTN